MTTVRYPLEAMMPERRPCQRCGGTGDEWLTIGDVGYYATCRDCYGSGLDDANPEDNPYDKDEPPHWWPVRRP
jgi:DnaJ-class molecular chaperone